MHGHQDSHYGRWVESGEAEEIDALKATFLSIKSEAGFHSLICRMSAFGGPDNGCFWRIAAVRPQFTRNLRRHHRDPTGESNPAHRA